MATIWIPSIVSAVGALVIVVLQFWLNGRSNDRIEQLRSDLTRQRSLYERRAEVYTNLYSLVVDAQVAVQEFLDAGPFDPDDTGEYLVGQHERLRQTSEALRMAFAKSRILLPRPLLDQLYSIVQSYRAFRESFVLWQADHRHFEETRIDFTANGPTGDALRSLEHAFRLAIEGRDE